MSDGERAGTDLNLSEKNILPVAPTLASSAQFVESETQNDRKRHTQSDKLRRLNRIEPTPHCNVWVGLIVSWVCKER